MLTVTASIGIAIYPHHGETAALLLKHADSAMYVAKHCPGSCVLYTTSMPSAKPTSAH